MESKYSTESIKKAYSFTFCNEESILGSKVCTCFYCGHQFDPSKEEDLDWIEEPNGKDRTLMCPACLCDCIVGDASGFPVTDHDFIQACTEEWFGGQSRISAGFPVEKKKPVTIIVD